MSRPKYYWHPLVKKMIVVCGSKKYSDIPAEQKYILAIEKAINQTKNQKNGDYKVQSIKDILLNRTETILSMAFKIGYSEKTIQNWINDFIRIVGFEAGYKRKEKKKMSIIDLTTELVRIEDARKTAFNIFLEAFNDIIKARKYQDEQFSERTEGHTQKYKNETFNSLFLERKEQEKEALKKAEKARQEFEVKYDEIIRLAKRKVDRAVLPKEEDYEQSVLSILKENALSLDNKISFLEDYYDKGNVTMLRVIVNSFTDEELTYCRITQGYTNIAGILGKVQSVINHPEQALNILEEWKRSVCAYTLRCDSVADIENDINFSKAFDITKALEEQKNIARNIL